MGGINPYAGAWGKTQVLHLLKRTMFGAKPADVTYFLNRTMDQAVDELLNPTAPAPAPPIKEYVTLTTVGVTPDPTVLQGTTWVNDINNDGSVQSQRRGSLKKWWTGLMLNQDRSIREKLIFFLVDHFGNEMGDVGNGNYAYKQIQLIRNFCLGDYKQLVYDITKDPHMLRYLNGYLNTGTAPDENYARELMELFTLGKGPGSGYTEADVKEAAKLLSGWQVNGNTHSTVFTASRHTSVNKTFSSFFGNRTIAGRTGATAGDAELTDLINMIFATPEVAKFMVRKFYRWFVFYEIDAAVEANVITPLADIFRNSNYQIKPVLLALFKSEHFYEAANMGCMIKNPIDVVIGGAREFNLTMPASTDWDTSYGHWNTLYANMINMGLNLYDPPNVAGMTAYYQEPGYYRSWITSDTLPRRNAFTEVMSLNGYTRNSFKMAYNFVEWAKTLGNPGNPNDLITDAIDYIYPIGLAPQTKQQLKVQILLSNQLYDYYWTNAWSAYISSPTTANFNVVNTRLRDLFKYLMNLSEYQLC
jgi:uncharacterized protein (DUF1800 family)